MSFPVSEMSFTVSEMNFPNLGEMSFGQNAQKKSLVRPKNLISQDLIFYNGRILPSTVGQIRMSAIVAEPDLTEENLDKASNKLSHNLFRSAFPAGFGWELLDIKKGYENLQPTDIPNEYKASGFKLESVGFEKVVFWFFISPPIVIIFTISTVSFF